VGGESVFFSSDVTCSHPQQHLRATAYRPPKDRGHACGDWRMARTGVSCAACPSAAERSNGVAMMMWEVRCAPLDLTWHRPQRLACGRAKHTHGRPQEGRLRLSAPRCLQSLSKPPIILFSAHSSNTHTRPSPLPPPQSFAITKTTLLDHISDQNLNLNTIRDTAWNTSSDPATLPASTSVASTPHHSRPRDRPSRLSHFLLYHHTSHGQSSIRFNG
jgi:hypothetical protein